MATNVIITRCQVCLDDNVAGSNCCFCKAGVCKNCIQPYLLSCVNDPKCINPDCNKTWAVEFMHTLTTKTFFTSKYKKHRETVLFDREQGYMPATMPYIERDQLRSKIYYEIHEKQKAIATMKEEIANMYTVVYDIERSPVNVTGNSSKSKSPRYVGRCGVAECRGFICAAAHNCSLCNTNYCVHCMEPKEIEHVCNPDNVETIKLMRKDTKACPCCATSIQKIAGCNSMWCPECKTSFYWNTLQIITDERDMHNPHLFAYLLEQGAGAANGYLQPGQPGMPGMVRDPCARQLTLNDVMHHVTRFRGMSPVTAKYLTENYRLLSHINGIELRGPAPRTVYGVAAFDNNLDIRKEFLEGNMTEKAFKAKLQIREKADCKKREIRNILTTFYEAGIVLYENMILAVPALGKTRMTGEQMRDQFELLRSFSKKALDDVSARYSKCKVPDLAYDPVMVR